MTSASQDKPGEQFKSVHDTNSSVLSSIMRLHNEGKPFDCDMTYGHGAFWKNLPRPEWCFDITPLRGYVTQADSRHLPLPSGSLGSCVFDPPFLTWIKGGRSHKDGKMAMSNRFGGYWAYHELEEHYGETIREAYRVLRPKGKLIFKCQDIIHNHRMHCTHVRVINMAEASGFRLADLFVLTAKSRITRAGIVKQQHARIWHSYFLVFERDRKKVLGANLSPRPKKSKVKGQKRASGGNTLNTP